MKKNAYKIYFQLFGKKMKYTVFAESEEKAREELRSKIQIDRIDTIDHEKLEQLAKELDKTFGAIYNAFGQFTEAFGKSIDSFFESTQKSVNKGIDAFAKEWNKNQNKTDKS